MAEPVRCSLLKLGDLSSMARTHVWIPNTGRPVRDPVSRNRKDGSSYNRGSPLAFTHLLIQVHPDTKKFTQSLLQVSTVQLHGFNTMTATITECVRVKGQRWVFSSIPLHLFAKVFSLSLELANWLHCCPSSSGDLSLSAVLFLAILGLQKHAPHPSHSTGAGDHNYREHACLAVILLYARFPALEIFLY